MLVLGDLLIASAAAVPPPTSLIYSDWFQRGKHDYTHTRAHASTHRQNNVCVYYIRILYYLLTWRDACGNRVDRFSRFCIRYSGFNRIVERRDTIAEIRFNPYNYSVQKVPWQKCFVLLLYDFLFSIINLLVILVGGGPYDLNQSNRDTEEKIYFNLCDNTSMYVLNTLVSVNTPVYHYEYVYVARFYEDIFFLF